MFSTAYDAAPRYGRDDDRHDRDERSGGFDMRSDESEGHRRGGEGPGLQGSGRSRSDRHGYDRDVRHDLRHDRRRSRSPSSPSHSPSRSRSVSPRRSRSVSRRRSSHGASSSSAYGRRRQSSAPPSADPWRRDRLPSSPRSDARRPLVPSPNTRAVAAGEAYAALQFCMRDEARTDEELEEAGIDRPQCSVPAGHTQLSKAHDGDMVMSEFNTTMLKYVKSRMGFPVSTPIKMRCVFANSPVFEIFDVVSYKSFQTFCTRKGAGALEQEGVVHVGVVMDSSQKEKRKSAKQMLGVRGGNAKERPQVKNYNLLRHILYAEAGIELEGVGASEEEPEDAVATSVPSQRGKTGKWTAKCDEIVASAEKGHVLMTCLRDRSILEKLFVGTSLESKGEQLLLNPVVGLCPFKYLDDDQHRECNSKRHVLGAANNLRKLIAKRQGHLLIQHKDAAAHRLAARLTMALDNRQMNEASITASAGAHIEAPLRDGLFDELPDLFMPPFKLQYGDHADAIARRDWMNGAVRLAATRAEAAAAAATAAAAAVHTQEVY